MSSLTKENIPHLCRACLRKLGKNENGLSINERQQGPAFYHIDRTNSLRKWMTIINPLEDVTRLKHNDQHKQFPQYVCRSCYENFKHVNDFKEMVVHSFSVLSKLLASSDEKKPTQIVQSVTESEVIVKSEPIDNYNDDDDDDDNDDDDEDNDDFDDEYMENDWETKNDASGNETRMDMLEANFKADTPKRTKSLGPKLSLSPPPIVDAEVGQPKAIKAYKCNTCKISYVHKYTYDAHIRQVHMGIERAFVCDICHRAYTKFPSLYRHMRREHNQPFRQYKCEYKNCHRSFRQLPTRRKHYEDFHYKEPLPSPSERVSHEEEYLSSGPSSSSSIAKTSPQGQSSSKLYRRNFICTICSRGFKNAHALKVHTNDCH